MMLQDKIVKMSPVKKLVWMSLLISMALVLSYFERFIPVFTFPGIKLGLANIVILIGIYLLSFKEIFLVLIIRIIMNSIFVGNMMSFWYSLAGGLLSFIVMYFIYKLLGNKVSVISISIIGGIFHNIGQLIVVALVTRKIAVALSYFPVLLFSGLITGLLIGLVVRYFMIYIRRLI